MKSSIKQALPSARLAEADSVDGSRSRVLGDLLREVRNLDDGQIERIVAYQRERGVRFGEAAVALKFVNREDVLAALSEQFQYTTGFAGREGDSELVAAADPFGDQADAFRELRTRLLLEGHGEPPRTAIAVVSPDSGDGKSYLAANLAVSFSQLGERTLLIDADVRTPRLHRMLRVESGSGLSGVLAGFPEEGGPLRAVPGLPDLVLLPAGAVPPNPLELLQRPRLTLLLREMLGRFDHVLIDTPAAIRGSDARVVAARAGAALVVARSGRSRMPALEGLVAALARSSTRIAGIVVNEH